MIVQASWTYCSPDLEVECTRFSTEPCELIELVIGLREDLQEGGAEAEIWVESQALIICLYIQAHTVIS